MPAALRLFLAIATLTTFWYGLFLSPALNSAPVAAAPAGATTAGSAAAAASGAAGAAGPVVLDDAAIDALLVASRDAFVGERWEDALAPTRTLVERFPGQHVYIARLAEILHKLERPADEAAAWELFMDRSPLPAEACPFIGNAYRRIGKYDLALGAFERCFAADRKNPELAFFVGLGHEWMGKYDQAQEFYQRAIAIASPHYDSEVGLARLRLHRNQLGEALSRAVAVLKKVPTHVDGLLVAGLAEQRAGHRKESRRYLENAVKRTPDYFDVQLALGVLDYSETRYADARTRFDIAWRLDAARRDEVKVWIERSNNVKGKR